MCALKIFMESIKQVLCDDYEESPSPASPRRIPAVGLCPPRSPRRLGTPVGRVTVLDSLLAFVVFSRMRGHVLLPSRKPPFGGIHPYTTEGAPGLYVRRTGSPAARGPFRRISNTDSITPPHTEARNVGRQARPRKSLVCSKPFAYLWSVALIPLVRVAP